MQPVKTIELGEIVTISKGRKHTETEHSEGAMPYLQIEDLSKTYNQKYTIEKGVEVTKDDLIIAWDGANAGKVGYNLIGLIGSTLARLRIVNNGIAPNFLYRFLDSQFDLIKSHRTGATIPHVSGQALKSIEIPLPDLDTQHHIAAVLDRADALRQKDRQLLAYYEALPQAVFLEMFGDEQAIKHRYEAINLYEVADIVSGVTKNTKQTGTNYIDVPYMRVANVQDGRIDLNEIKTINVPPSDLQKFRLQRNDILLTEGGDPDKLGRGAVWHDQIADCIHQNHIFRVRPNQQLVNPTFLSFLIGSRYGKRYFLKAAKQTTGIASINMQQLKRFPAVVPPIDRQNQFSQAITEVEQQKKSAMVQLATSEALFQSLLHDYFGRNS